MRAADPAGSLPAVRALAGVLSAALFGGTLHVAADAAADPRTLFGAVSGISGYEPIPPTLEDVFLHIAGKSE